MKYIKTYENINFEDVESIDGFKRNDIVKFKSDYKDYADDSSIRIDKPKVSEGLYKIINLFIYNSNNIDKIKYATIENIKTGEVFDREIKNLVLAKDYEISANKYNI